jgi:hypothetical protein
MRPCPEFYGSDARRAPAAAPQLLTGLCRTRLDQRARAARASRTSSASGCPQEGRQPPRALLLGATSANGTHAISGRRGGTPRPAHKARATDRGTPLHLVVLSGCLVNFGRDGRSPCKAEPAPLRPVGREPAPWPRAGNSECRRRSSIWGMTSPFVGISCTRTNRSKGSAPSASARGALTTDRLDDHRPGQDGLARGGRCLRRAQEHRISALTCVRTHV